MSKKSAKCEKPLAGLKIIAAPETMHVPHMESDEPEPEHDFPVLSSEFMHHREAIKNPLFSDTTQEAVKDNLSALKQTAKLATQSSEYAKIHDHPSAFIPNPIIETNKKLEMLMESAAETNKLLHQYISTSSALLGSLNSSIIGMASDSALASTTIRRQNRMMMVIVTIACCVIALSCGVIAWHFL